MGDKLLVNFWREISALICNFTCNFSISCWVDEANREAILTSLSANLTLLTMHLTLLLEIMHCVRNLQIMYRLVNNLLVVLFPRINCRLLANEKKDDDYNVKLQNCHGNPSVRLSVKMATKF